MPSQTIAQSLAYVNWTLLAALSLGALAVVVLAPAVARPTTGYLRFTALCAAVLAGLALLGDLGLPAPEGLAIEPTSASDPVRRSALAVLAVCSFAYALTAGNARRAGVVGSVGLAAGAVAFASAAVGWAGGALGGIPLLVQFLVLAAASGGALAALILGHWYLVTPRLSERPLVFVTRSLTVVMGLQLALFVVWVTIGGGPGQPAFEAVTGGPALLTVLRLVVGILFPLVLSWLAFRTARTRSMESATGLLYIDVAAVVSSTIVAAALYFTAGILV